MALNFPNTPNIGDTYTQDDAIWEWDGTAWNIASSDTSRNIFVNFTADTGSASPDTLEDILVIEGGNNVTTSITNKTLTIDSTGTTQNLFATITSDDGNTTADSSTDTLNVLGGTNISTIIATDTDNLTINMDAFSIDFLSDVDTTSSSPTTGQVLKWNGTNWVPGSDATSGGGGTDADTLDGFDSSYFLNYNNLSNTPSVVALNSFSIGNELTASGNGAISYDNTTGVFRYTPPDLSIYSTFDGAFSSLTGTPTTLAGYGITDSPTELTDLGISDGSSGQVLTTDGAGNFSFTTVTSGGSSATTFVGLTDTPSSFGDPGQIVAVNGTGNGLIFITDQTGEGEPNQNAFSNIAVTGQTTVTADTSTDTLTLAAGTNISLTTSGNTVTINSTASGGSTNFSTLNDVTAAGLRVDQIYEPAIAMLRVNNNGSSSYTFNSHYSGDNPTIYAISGTTIAFDLSEISGHPFEIQDNTLNAITSNLVHVDTDGTVSLNSAAQGKESGTLYWRIPANPNSSTFIYQCQFHAGMFGTITVKLINQI